MVTRWSPLEDAVVTAGGSDSHRYEKVREAGNAVVTAAGRGGHRGWKRWSPLVEAVDTAGGSGGHRWWKLRAGGGKSWKLQGETFQK